MTPSPKSARVPRNFETIAWSWMRYSGFLLIFLAFGHIILQDVIVGVHAIDLNYVQMRWANIGWRVFDALLLAFAFAHGVNGVRQVINDYVHDPRWLRVVNIGLLIFWALITLIGAAALIGGVSVS